MSGPRGDAGRPARTGPAIVVPAPVVLKPLLATRHALAVVEQSGAAEQIPEVRAHSLRRSAVAVVAHLGQGRTDGAALVHAVVHRLKQGQTGVLVASAKGVCNAVSLAAELRDAFTVLA